MFFRRPLDGGFALGAVVATLGCESLIGGDFGKYEKAAAGGGATDGGTGRGGGSRGGTNGGGTAGTATGGSGAATGGATAGDGGAAAAGGEPPCEPTGPMRRFRASALAAGDSHTCAVIESTGELKCFGGNARGQLGLGHTRSVGADECEPSSTPFVDLGTYRTVTPIAGAMGALVLGGAHTCVILDNYKVKCWGDNEFGQLGLDDTEARGDEPDEMGDALPYVDLGGDYKAYGLAAGLHHTCALIEVAQDVLELKCWGSNVSGQLGAGRSDAAIGDEPGEMATLAVVDFDPLLTIGLQWRSLSLGNGHTCAVTNIGTVKCWGANDAGQLGLGSTRVLLGTSPEDMGQNLPEVDLGNRQVASITAGAMHTCALSGDGPICWGKNESGQLGLGHARDIGRDAADMGTALPPVTLSDDLTINALYLDAGVSHTCATLVHVSESHPEHRTVKCWGGNDRGQLGLGDRLSRGAAMDELGAALAAVPVEGSVVPVAGAFHSCALFYSLDAVCWGENGNGQLGRGGPTDPLGDMAGEVEALTPIDLGGP